MLRAGGVQGGWVQVCECVRKVSAGWCSIVLGVDKGQLHPGCEWH